MVGALQISLQLLIVIDIHNASMFYYFYSQSKNTVRYILLYMQIISQTQDLVFVRHGESMKNSAVHKYISERNLPEDWSIFGKDPYFIQTVTHNPDLIDCHLSPEGIQQVNSNSYSVLGCSRRAKGLQPRCHLVLPFAKGS